MSLALNRLDVANATHAAHASFGMTTHEHIGFALGWDYAHHRLAPPAPYAQEPSPLRNGLLAAEAAFGARTLAATPAVRQWLQLRLNAWLRGHSVELFQVTPNYLQQIAVSHCPVTRAPLSNPADAAVNRVRNDAGYAAGNLVLLSAKASHAKAGHGFRAALALAETARQAEAAALRNGPTAGSAVATTTAPTHGLTAAEWQRMAILCSFVEALPHAEACALPLAVLPPNRLRLFNPAQALQAFISQQLLRPGWAARNRQIEALIPGAEARRAFQAFVHALLPRVLEAGARGVDVAKGNERPAEPQRSRWALEDAWAQPRVLARWTTFATLLSPAQCEALVLRASAQQLGHARVERSAPEASTEGWNLASRGYVPHAVLVQRSARPAGFQACLPL